MTHLSDPLTPARLSEIRADMRTILYISDGTSGSDKVARLLSAVPDLLAEVDRLTAALNVAEKAIEKVRTARSIGAQLGMFNDVVTALADYDAAKEALNHER